MLSIVKVSLFYVVILRKGWFCVVCAAHLKELFLPLAIVCGSEVLVDWIKHAFITKFNSISSTVYREYTLILARDVMDSKHHLVSLFICNVCCSRLLPCGILLVLLLSGSFEYVIGKSVVNGAEWLGGNSQQVTGDSGLI